MDAKALADELKISPKIALKILQPFTRQHSFIVRAISQLHPQRMKRAKDDRGLATEVEATMATVQRLRHGLFLALDIH